jgi:hypothetical protein
VESIRRAFAAHPKAQALEAMLSGDGQDELAALGKVFGEELPSGLTIRVETA